MSKLFHGIFHVVCVGLQVANAAGMLVPPPGNMIVAGGMAAVQGIVAIANHKRKKLEL